MESLPDSRTAVCAAFNDAGSAPSVLVNAEVPRAEDALRTATQTGDGTALADRVMVEPGLGRHRRGDALAGRSRAARSTSSPTGRAVPGRDVPGAHRARLRRRAPGAPAGEPRGADSGGAGAEPAGRRPPSRHRLVPNRTELVQARCDKGTRNHSPNVGLDWIPWHRGGAVGAAGRACAAGRAFSGRGETTSGGDFLTWPKTA